MLKRAFLLTLALCLLSTAPGAAQDSESGSAGESAENVHNLVFLHSNDVRGRLLPQRSEGSEIGGALARAGFIAERRRHDGLGWLVLDAGGLFGSSPESEINQGYWEIELMNRMGYDAANLGPTDFRYGMQALKERVAQAEFPVVASNVIDTSDNSPIGERWTTVERKGLTVGVFGVANPQTPRLLNPALTQGVTFVRPQVVFDETLPEVRANSDVVVMLSQLGLQRDLELASRLEGVDVIVGGGSKAMVQMPYQVNDTLVVQAYQHGLGMGQLKTTFETKQDGSQNLRYFDYNYVRFDGSQPSAEVPDIQEMVGNLRESVDLKLTEVVGEASSTFPSTNLLNAENELGTFIADAMRRYADAQVGLINGGGLRGGLPQGPITLQDIYNIIPPSRRLVKLRMSGQRLARVLSHSASSLGRPAFLQMSGLSMEVFGGEVYNVQIDGEPLDPSATYSVATTDHLASGALRYLPLAELVGTGPASQLPLASGETVQNTGKTVRAVVTNRIRQQSPVSPELEGTLSFLSSAPDAQPATELSTGGQTELEPYEGLETPTPDGEDGAGGDTAEQDSGSTEQDTESESESPRDTEGDTGGAEGDIQVPVQTGGGASGSETGTDSGPPPETDAPSGAESADSPADSGATSQQASPGELTGMPAGREGVEIKKIGETSKTTDDGFRLTLKVDYVTSEEYRPLVRYVFRVRNTTDEVKILEFPTLQETDYSLRGVESGEVLWNYAHRTNWVKRDRTVTLPAGAGIEYHGIWSGLNNRGEPVATQELYRFNATLKLTENPLSIGFDSLLREGMFPNWRD